MKDTGPKSSVQEPMMRDIQRESYMLDHFSHKCGAMGSLMTLSLIPIVAGDSMSVRANFVFRLSPLRRQMYLDARVDLYAFYVRHRMIYLSNAAGSRFEDWLKAGYDEGITLGTSTLAGGHAGNNYNCLGYFFTDGATIPKWVDYGYMQIFRNYFKDPTDTTAYADTYFEATPTSNELNFGLACCHLKRIWNTAVLVTTTSADYSLPLSGGEVDLYQFSQLQGRLETETERDWYSVRYRDLLQNTWDSHANPDTDLVPELVMHTSSWLSGKDIDGTDDATLGDWAGKAAGLMSLNIPSKFFPEHGALWIMALVRFPAIAYGEWNYLVSKDEPTYKQLARDPAVIRREPPIDLNLNEIFDSGPNVVVGKVPYAQWYREQPSLVHEYYSISSGHPFLSMGSISTRNGAIYIGVDGYDQAFKTIQLKHWQSQGFIEIDAKRFIPRVNDSIYAGTQ